MPVQDYIKFAYEKTELPIKEIARRTGVCWRTAEKYAKREDWNEGEGPPRRRPVMDQFGEIVDTWLLEDRLRRRKERRNGAAIYRQLKEEHGFTGGARTVRGYVAGRRVELFGGEKAPYVELEHAAGEAQADFGQATAVQDGKLVDVQVLVLSFPFSNAGFAYPLPAQNQECFLEGLKRLFEQAGGIPQRICFDNLGAAVVHVGKGEERALTDAFRNFKMHYRFEADFCNGGKGNEKGHVENKVGYTRRQWLCPLRAMESHEALAEHLHAEALRDMQRDHYKKGVPMAELWQSEQRALFALPVAPYEVARLDHAVLNNYAQFRWQKAMYEVPQGQPRQKVLLKVFWDRLEVRSAEGTLLTTLPRQYMRDERPIDWAAHFVIYAKRPRAAIHAALFRHMPAIVQEFLAHATPELRATRVRLLRDVLKNHSMDQVARALAELPPDRVDDRASLEQKLYMLHPDHALPPPLPQGHTPANVASYEPDSAVYDQLTPSPAQGGAGR